MKRYIKSDDNISSVEKRPAYNRYMTEDRNAVMQAARKAKQIVRNNGFLEFATQ